MLRKLSIISLFCINVSCRVLCASRTRRSCRCTLVARQICPVNPMPLFVMFGHLTLGMNSIIICIDVLGNTYKCPQFSNIGNQFFHSIITCTKKQGPAHRAHIQAHLATSTYMVSFITLENLS